MWWHTVTHGRGSEGETGELSVQPVLFTLPRNMVYPALLPTIKVDAHTSAASSRLNWRPRPFKLTRQFRRKAISGFCPCAITFQLASTSNRQVSSVPQSYWLKTPGTRVPHTHTHTHTHTKLHQAWTVGCYSMAKNMTSEHRIHWYIFYRMRAYAGSAAVT
jgi:hypothetical protein